MSVLQLSLLILALVAIGLVAFISYQRSSPPRARKAPKLGAKGEEQLDLLAEEGAAAQFDEFGVSEPRPRGGTAPTMPPRQEAEPAAAAASAPSATVQGEQSERDDKIISLFIMQRDGEAVPGPDIHRQLRGLGLDPGDRLTYERRVDGKTWFHVANMRKPGHLDPAEADRFSTPGLSLFLLLGGLDEPLAALDDLLATADRLARAFDGVVLDAQRQPLSAEAASAMRNDVRRWYGKQRGA